MSLNSELFTYPLTNEDSPFVLTAEDGLELSCIKVGVGGAGTITGTRSVAGLPSQPVLITEGDVVNFSTDKGLSQVTITIASGTIYIMGT
jgi:hypothetical protein